MIDKVLCVDDDEISLFISKVLIQDSSFAAMVDTAISGHKALDYFSELSPEEAVPRVIFLDLNMPEMDGWEFLDLFEKSYANKFPDTSVVILSSSIDPKDQKKAQDYKIVSDFVSKPLTFDVLDRISSDLKKQK